MARPFLTTPITDDRALGGSAIERSLRFDNGSSARLTRTIGSTSNRRTFTYSWWLKRTMNSTEQYVWYVGSSGGTPYLDARFEANGHQLQIQDYTPSRPIRFITNRQFRDCSSWYHFVFAVDTTQGTNTNRAKLYVNGVQETSFSTETYPDQNYDSSANVSGHIQVWGTNKASTSNDLDGYLAEVHFVDGQQLTPSSFGYTDDVTGIWRPKKYVGTHGTNGFHLDFSDNSAATATTIGKDRSGNGNDFTPSNISVSSGTGNDSVLDTPSNNFCTLNRLDVYGDGLSESITEGNLVADNNSGSYRTTRSTVYLKTGKWYWEVTIVNAGGSSGSGLVGVAGKDYNAGSGSRRAYSSNGQKYIGSGSSYGATWTTNDVIGVALDLDIGTITFYKNNVSQGVAFTDMLTTIADDYDNDGWTPIINGYNNYKGAINFGQQPFTYTPPAGHKTICSNNLLSHNIPAVIRPKKYFDILEWTGNDSNDRDITGLQFKPDFVWIKNKEGPDWPNLQNVVTGANVMMYSNRDDGPATDNGNGHVNSFIEGGFNVTAGSSGNVNENNEDYVAWCWKAGGAAVTNDDGTIQTTISANQESGFSIMTWSGNGSAGSTVGHGLGRKPKLIIVKRKSGGNQSWFIRIASIYGAAAGKYIKLQDPGSVSGVDTNVFPNTEPTSTVFSLGADSGVNASGSTYLCYCWAEIPGFSKFISYNGNGNADGSFVYTGFKPRMFIFKRVTGGNSGYVPVDTSRAPINPSNIRIELNGNAAQDSNSAYSIDILSNGFKSRNSNSEFNASSVYVVWAWADTPGNTPFGTEPSAK